MKIDRHKVLFDPTKVQSVGIVGIGAIGSKVLDGIMRLGIDDINVYDMDIVEDINLSNQCFLDKHVGMSKVAAAIDYASLLGVSIKGVNQKIDISDVSAVPIHECMILCVDSMELRRDLMKLYYANARVKVIFEARMSVDELQVFRVVTRNDYKEWLERSNYATEVETFGMCRTKQSLGIASGFSADMIISALMFHYNENQLTPNHIIMTFNGDYSIQCYTW